MISLMRYFEIKIDEFGKPGRVIMVRDYGFCKVPILEDWVYGGSEEAYKINLVGDTDGGFVYDLEATGVKYIDKNEIGDKTPTILSLQVNDKGYLKVIDSRGRDVESCEILESEARRVRRVYQ